MILPQEKLIFKPTEVGSLLGIGRNGVYALIHTDKLRSIKIGRKLLVPASAIREFLDGEKS